MTALRTGWPAPRQPSAKKTLTVLQSPGPLGASASTSTRAIRAVPSGSSVIGLVKERTTALTAPRRPSQSFLPPATPDLLVVSVFSKPTVRSPPWAASAPTVPSVVIPVIVPPSAAILMDQPWAPPRFGLFVVVNLQSRVALWTEPGAPVTSPPQASPSKDSETSCPQHCPETRIPNTATRAPIHLKFITDISLS